jgi:hypothetical protein
MKDKQTSTSKKSDLYRVLGFVFFCLMLAACSPAPASPQALPTATPTIPPPTPTQQLPTPTSALECPNPTEGMQLLRNDAYSYCFLYPDGYNRVDPLPYEVCLVPEGPAMACHTANLMLEVEEALGRTVDQIAGEMIAGEPVLENVERTSLTVGGEEAVMLDGLGGQAATRRILIVHDEQLYELWFIPWDEAGEGFEDLNMLYEAVINSFTFVPGAP